jgi:hypothetical protein
MNLDCEWNVNTDKPLTVKEIFEGKSHAKATWFLGQESQLAVCDKCAKNPVLVKRFKIKKPIV